jgi:hypothetical protein
MSDGEEIQSGLIVVDGVSKLSVMDGITKFLAGEWKSLSNDQHDQEWEIHDINIRNTCARSFGPYGYVMVAFDYTKSSVMDELEKGECVLQAYASRQQVPHFEREHAPDILGGVWYMERKLNVRVKVLPALEGFRYDIKKDRGHVVVQVNVPDSNLDLVSWCESLKASKINVRQHEGALHVDGNTYRYAFRLSLPKKVEDEKIVSIIKAIAIEKYGKEVEENLDIRIVSPRQAELFTSAVLAYGAAQKVQEEEYTYVYAHAKDRQGLLGDIADFFVTTGLDNGESRSVVRSSCRALLGYTSVLLCLKGVKAGDALFAGSNQVLLETELLGTPVLAEYASLCGFGPWSASGRSTAVRFKASHPDERGLMKRTLLTIESVVQRRLGQAADIDISEYDAWTSLGNQKTPGKTTVACCIRLPKCDASESSDIRKAVQRSMLDNGWAFKERDWLPRVLI